VKVIGAVLVPTAISFPRTTRDFPPLNLTVTPGSTVRVLPLETTTESMTMYGLAEASHVVSELNVPETLVSPSAAEL
jgi:hypothetical protein